VVPADTRASRVVLTERRPSKAAVAAEAITHIDERLPQGADAKRLLACLGEDCERTPPR